MSDHLYWDVFPKLIRVSCSLTQQAIPLSIRGEGLAPVYDSSNPEVAEIDGAGTIRCGLMPGAAMIMVWSSSARTSVRHVQVEVYGQPSGEVEE